MNNIVKSTKELLDEILSGNPQMVWSSSCAIMKLSQDDEGIKEFVPYLDEIKEKTANLDMGGVVVSNDRFVKKVIKSWNITKQNQDVLVVYLMKVMILIVIKP